MTWILSLASVVAVSLVSLVGLATVSADPARMRRTTAWLVSFAVGSLLGDAFIHLVREVFARAGGTGLRESLLILAGMMLFFAVEKLLRREHGLAAINVIGDAVHNFIDGALIAASYLVSPALGFSTTLAVVLHEIPQELGDFGVLIHSGLTVRRAVSLNLATASAAILGNVATLCAGAAVGSQVSDFLVPITAGGFIYIASADLIPELQRDRSLSGLFTQGALLAAGVGVMVALVLLD